MSIIDKLFSRIKRPIPNNPYLQIGGLVPPDRNDYTALEQYSQIGWLGGVSFLPYSYKFTSHLKESIKARDNHHCRICGIEDKLYIHHIDYDKLNTDPVNLISLCLPCHAKTNYNRNCWGEYLKYKNWGFAGA